MYYGVADKDLYDSKMTRPSHGRAAREGGRLGLNNNDSSHLTKSELLPGSHPSRLPVHGTLEFSNVHCCDSI